MNGIDLRRLALVCASAALIPACAANVCQRKARYFKEQCRGGDVSFSDPTCELNLSRCSDAEKAMIEGYVACLESQNECSFENTSRCAAQYPGGVNLRCSGK